MENSVEKEMPESNKICRICIYLLFISKIQNGEKIDTYKRALLCKRGTTQVCTEESNIAIRYFKIWRQYKSV